MRRHPHKLAPFAAVAAPAGEDQIPDAVDIAHLMTGAPRDKVVDVGQVLVAAIEANRRVAVEASPFLVAVEAVATAGDGYPTGIAGAEQLLFGRIVLDGDQAAGDVHRPRLLDQPPAGLGFMDQVRVLLALRQPVKAVGQADALMRFALVDKKSRIDFALIDVMKLIQHHAKAELHRGGGEPILVYLPAVKAVAGIKELASGGGDLLRRLLQMAAQMLAEGQRQVFEQDQVAAVAADVVQGMGQRELVGGDVLAKQNNAAPVVLQRGFDLIETHSGHPVIGKVSALLRESITGSDNKWLEM